MRLRCWMRWILLPSLISAPGAKKPDGKHFLLDDNFSYTKLKNDNHFFYFLNKNTTVNETLISKRPQMESEKLYLKKQLFRTLKESTCYFLSGKNCSDTLSENTTRKDSCTVKQIRVTNYKKSVDNDPNCSKTRLSPSPVILDVNSEQAISYDCKQPKRLTSTHQLKTQTSAQGANDVMTSMANLASTLTEDTALSGGEYVEGVILVNVAIEEPEEVSFAYQLPNDSFNIIYDGNQLLDFSRTVTVPKEALEKAISSNVTDPFLAVVRFRNLIQDEKNSTVLGNEVIAVEMGVEIKHLMDNIKINFKDMIYSGIPTCHSWDGNGTQPRWTSEGSKTLTSGNSISCQFSHLTFFAILLSPPNETISSSDLNNLTIITQVGCGVSLFFLSIVLVMHFLVRRAQATNSTRILIHLVVAMLLLNFTFLINNHVARLKNAVGCKIMAVLMHYSMLATFTWFAAHSLHLYLLMSSSFDFPIKRYVLKLAVCCWGIPSVFGIALLITGKYGEQVVRAEDPEDNVVMCWLTDETVHYAVNIGYYAVVFLFTFSLFVSVLTYLCFLRRTNSSSQQVQRSCISMGGIMGLCTMLGLTWGFAFFAYGPMRIPSYYIFTTLNSFQGFFIFIYYYTHRQHWANTIAGGNTSATNTCQTVAGSVAQIFENPYYSPDKTKTPQGEESTSGDAT